MALAMEVPKFGTGQIDERRTDHSVTFIAKESFLSPVHILDRGTINPAEIWRGTRTGMALRLGPTRALRFDRYFV